jgi:hypothetical protein
MTAETQEATTMTTPAEVIAQVFRDYCDVPRWVEWRPEPRNDGSGKVDKVPYVAGSDSRKASSTNPKSWRTLAPCRGDRRDHPWKPGKFRSFPTCKSVHRQ